MGRQLDYGPDRPLTVKERWMVGAIPVLFVIGAALEALLF